MPPKRAGKRVSAAGSIVTAHAAGRRTSTPLNKRARRLARRVSTPTPLVSRARGNKEATNKSQATNDEQEAGTTEQAAKKTTTAPKEAAPKWGFYMLKLLKRQHPDLSITKKSIYPIRGSLSHQSIASFHVPGNLNVIIMNGDVRFRAVVPFQILDSFMNDIFERFATEGAALVKKAKKKTLTDKDFAIVAKLILPGELGPGADRDAKKAVELSKRSYDPTAVPEQPPRPKPKPRC